MYIITQNKKLKILFTEISTLKLTVDSKNKKQEILGVEIVVPDETYFIECKTKFNREYLLGEYKSEEDAKKDFNKLVDLIKNLPLDSWGDDTEYEIGSEDTEPTPPTDPDEPDKPTDPDTPPTEDDPPVEEPQPKKFIAANLTAVEGETGPAFGQAETYTVEIDPEDPTQVILTATGLQKTVNSLGSEDYWVGIGVLKQDNATYNWNFGTKPESVEYRTIDRVQSDGDTKYTTLYWSSDDSENPWSETEGYISVKVDEEVTDYKVKFNVTVATE